jgi:hypothetical protein
MNTKALSSLAELICRAQEQDRTPMGIAFAINSAGRHMSPETAEELAALRTQVAELLAERHSTNEALDDAAKALRADRDRIAELEAQRERRRVRLVALQNDALNMRGSLSPMGGGRKVPFPLGETLTPAVDWLIARVAELEALTPAAVQTCRKCGAGYTYGEPCSNCLFRERMKAELQARSLEDPHDSPLHHSYRLGHDLPELGGAL